MNPIEQAFKKQPYTGVHAPVSYNTHLKQHPYYKSYK